MTPIFTEVFRESGQTFAERTGDPDEFSCAIGRISICFSVLDEELDRVICFLLKLDEDTVEAITSEMAFKNKVHLFASLVRKKFDAENTQIGPGTLEIYLQELVARTFEVEQFRNRIMHSKWVGPFLRDNRAVMRKSTAKAAKGHRVSSQDVDAGYLLDVADQICYVAEEIGNFHAMLAEQAAPMQPIGAVLFR